MDKNINLPERSVSLSRRYAYGFLIRTLFVVGVITLILSWNSRYADPLKFVIYRMLEYAQRAISYIV